MRREPRNPRAPLLLVTVVLAPSILAAVCFATDASHDPPIPKVCQYMEPHIREKLEATVVRVSPAGLMIDLNDYNVTAFLPAKLLGERSVVKGPTLTVRAGRRMLSFSEGYPIPVRLQDVDFTKLQLLLEPA